MKSYWLALGVLQICIFCSLAQAAAYPEAIWLDTEIESNILNKITFSFESDLFRASAVKNICSLGGRFGCALQ